MNLHSKLRRPSGEHNNDLLNHSSVQEVDRKKMALDPHGYPEQEASQVLTDGNSTTTFTSKCENAPLVKIEGILNEEKNSKQETLKVNFAIHDEMNVVATKENKLNCSEDVLETPEDGPHSTNDHIKAHSKVKVKKVEETPVEEIMQSAKSAPPEPEPEPKKKLRKVRKPVEKPTANPRVTRHRADLSNIKNSPSKTPTRPNALEQATKNMKFQPPSSSPMRKNFTPKLVFR